MEDRWQRRGVVMAVGVARCTPTESALRLSRGDEVLVCEAEFET